MIKFIKSWCEGIIVAVMISIIIEMLLPEGNNKKYVKVVVGIYILFVIIGPFLEKINIGDSIESFFEYDSIEVSTELNDNIKNVYVKGIEETIKNELIEYGYFVENVVVDVDKNYENIEKIEITLSIGNENDIKINPVSIGEDKFYQKEDIKLKNIISENYGVQPKDIYIFEK